VEILIVRANSLLFVASALPLVAACSLLLDFGSLQGGKKNSPDGGADANSNGAGGASEAGAEAGAAGACDLAACDDGDPCTTSCACSDIACAGPQ
jgi:hypothetical protein